MLSLTRDIEEETSSSVDHPRCSFEPSPTIPTVLTQAVEMHGVFELGPFMRRDALDVGLSSEATSKMEIIVHCSKTHTRNTQRPCALHRDV